jgi:Tol biopolymer transport system component
MSVSRRDILKTAVAALVVPGTTHAQTGVFGRIAFIKHGNIMQWSPDGITELKADGDAMSPSWSPDTNMMVYVRNGGSFSNLISLDTETGRTRRLTNSESQLQRGSEDYVADSVWITDPWWSESNIIVFGSTADSVNGFPQLWILRYESETVFLGPTDYMESGWIEKITVDANGKYACYTVLGDGMVSYIGMRDLDTGATWPVLEGAHGAFDSAISPNGRWVIGTIRDSDDVTDLWLTNVDSDESYRLTEGENASATTWDYFGESVAYLAYVGDGFSLRAFRIDFTRDEPAIDGDIQVLIEKDNIDSTSRLSWNR